jgi:predicted aspartyl protease
VRSLIPFAALFMAGGAALNAQPSLVELEATGEQGAVDKTTQTEDVRFRDDRYERMTVPVRLSGTGPYRFLVDTGADRTAISHQLAAKLNLGSTGNATLHSVTGVSRVATATVPSLQLTRRNLRVNNAPLLDSADMGADGILGVDSLRSQRVLFDFEGQTISIVPSIAQDVRNEPGAIVVQAKRRKGHLILTQATANGRRVNVVVDTGSQFSIGNSALRRQLLGSRQLTNSHQVELESVTGQKLVGDLMFIRQVEIGGIQLKNLAVVFADSHAFRKLDLNDKPALLLGMNAMRAFKRVSIDFANKKLRIVLPEHSAIETHVAEARPIRLR